MSALLVVDVAVLVAGVVGMGRLDENHMQNRIGRQATAQGKVEQKALEKDPVLDARVSGTRFRSESSKPAGRDLWNALQATEIRRLYDISGEPGAVVEAYRAPAEAAGWRFLEVECSPRFGSTSMRFVKDFDGFSATLQLYGHLDRPEPESGRRGLVLILRGVMYDHVNRPVAQNPESASLRRRDVHCLERCRRPIRRCSRPPRCPHRARRCAGCSRSVPPVHWSRPSPRAGRTRVWPRAGTKRPAEARSRCCLRPIPCVLRG